MRCLLSSYLTFWKWKWKWSRSVVSDSLRPHGLQPTKLLPLSMGFSRQEYRSGLPFPSPGDPPDPGIELRSPALQADSLPAEPQGKPKNTGVGSLSLLQQIFPTQESNWGLLHCRQILYQLSYQGSPERLKQTFWPTQYMNFEGSWQFILFGVKICLPLLTGV